MIWLQEPGRVVRHAYRHIDARKSVCGLDGGYTVLFDDQMPKCRRCARLLKLRAARRPGHTPRGGAR
jgi:hypothetical protein